MQVVNLINLFDWLKDVFLFVSLIYHSIDLLLELYDLIEWQVNWFHFNCIFAITCIKLIDPLVDSIVSIDHWMNSLILFWIFHSWLSSDKIGTNPRVGSVVKGLENSILFLHLSGQDPSIVARVLCNCHQCLSPSSADSSKFVIIYIFI